MTSTHLVEAVNKAVGDLKRFRDETRLQMHLAGREARDRWRVLEDKLTRTLDSAHEFAESTARVLDELKTEVREFRASLRGSGKRPRPTHRDGLGRSVS